MSGGYGWGGITSKSKRGWVPTSTATAYTEAVAWLGKRETKNLSGADTKLVRYNDGALGVEYVGTHIVEYYPDGRIEFDHGGWHTPTTRNKIKSYAPGVRCWTQKSVLWIKVVVGSFSSAESSPALLFEPGIILHPDGVLQRPGEEHLEAVARHAAALLPQPPAPPRARRHTRVPSGQLTLARCA
jgi:hypothetical protein